MVAVLSEHVYHILFRPFLEETVIAVVALRDIPFIKGLQHHHESHLITKLYEFRSRHVMSRTDGVTTHVLQQFQLMAQSRYIHSRPQRAQVVVITYPLELTPFSVQEETFVGNIFNGPDTEAGNIRILQFPSGINLRHRLIQHR